MPLVVIGAWGDLSMSSGLSELNSVQLVDYNAALPTNSIDLYYHTSNEEKQMIFPIDPDIIHTQLTSSTTSQKRETFWEGVIAWDGKICLSSLNVVTTYNTFWARKYILMTFILMSGPHMRTQ